MIKVYCDKCSKEIAGNVNQSVEHNEVKDALGITLFVLPKIIHLCDECQYDELTCGFKVGDMVVTDDGRVGIIESICDCDRCKDRGFYEPKVETIIGNDKIWISDTDKKNGFINFYRIGDQVFGNIDKTADEYIRERITDLQHELVEYKLQLKSLLDLKK